MRGLEYFLQTFDEAPLLLDLYPADLAYSLRKLRRNYSGSAIEVRRSSNNDVANIGFNGVNLDTGSLLAFVGAGDGFVVTKYGQSLSAINATQTTTSKQPKIVESGSVILENGTPTIRYDGAQELLLTFDWLGAETNIFTVGKHTSSTVEGNLFNISDADYAASMGFNFLSNSNTYGGRTLPKNDLKGDAYDQQQALFTLQQTNEILDSYNSFKDSIIATGNFGGRTTYNAVSSIGSRNGTFYLNGNVQELVLYNSNQSANRTAIQDNINAYYNIY